MQTNSALRRYDYDILRVCAMLAVVYLHTAAGALREITPVAGQLTHLPNVWIFSNFLTALATAAVPLFFMLSGALLLGSETTGELRPLFRKRLPKVLVPLLAWSGVVILLTGVRAGGSVALLQKLLPLLNTPVLVPYWFVYAILPVYLLSPLLKKMVDGMTPAHWRYLMLLWVVLTLGLNTLCAFVPAGLVPAFTVHWTLNINVVGGYLGYFLLGYFLAQLQKIPARKWLWTAAVGSYLVIALGTWWDTARTGIYSERYKSYLNLFAMILAAALFLLARSYWQEHRAGGRLLTLLSANSFGVYLLHPLAIEAVRALWPRLFSGSFAVVDTIREQLLFYGGTVLLCMLGTVLLASIKPLCYLMTGQRFSAACRESNLFALLPPKATKQSN